MTIHQLGAFLVNAAIIVIGFVLVMLPAALAYRRNHMRRDGQ